MPSLHGNGADAPSGQYEPGAHAWHSVWPDAFMNLPAAQLSHLGCLFPGCTVPALHGVCSVLPVGAKWPASVSTHSLSLVRFVAFEYEPFAHGSGALAPSGQYDPGSQATHACLPSARWNVPAAHLSHVGLPASGWTVPALHLVCSVLPAGAKWPASVPVRASARERSEFDQADHTQRGEPTNLYRPAP